MATDYADKDYNEVPSKNKCKGKQSDNWSTPARTSQQHVITPFSETLVIKATFTTGLLTLEPLPNDANHVHRTHHVRRHESCLKQAFLRLNWKFIV